MQSRTASLSSLSRVRVLRQMLSSCSRESLASDPTAPGEQLGIAVPLIPRGNVHTEQWEVRPPLRSQQNRFAFEFKLQGVHGMLTNAASVSSPVTWVMAISLCSFPSAVTKRFSTLN